MNIFDCYMRPDWLVQFQPIDETGANSLSQRSTKDITPKLFQYSIVKEAKQSLQHIILPEGNDRRVLIAAGYLANHKLAKITLLGNPVDLMNLATKNGIDISQINVIDPTKKSLQQDFLAQKLYECRKIKGMTLSGAQDLITNPNYFGTMLMKENLADGMVSGAIHSTADTMRPAMQIIKTCKPGSLVSSVFFMLLPNRVFVYGDCAINVNPTAEQLGDVAVASALTAKQFGIDPRLAMISYATGDSNKGPMIDKVAKATEYAQNQLPGVPIEGPIQFDAATNERIASVKIKHESKVAGNATVCIFPDLNTGNTAYKAVQQSTGCIAMGPVIQGLRKPVNDLSRGCTIDDIINTVIITSVQAIGMKKTK